MSLLDQVSIIDVRTPMEFQGGHVVGSVNIPLNEIPERVDELKAISKKVIFCCASGARSGQATAFMRQYGLDCENGGSWLDVNYAINQSN